MRGEKDGGQRGGLFKADAVGQLETQILMQGGIGAEAVGRQPAHAISRPDGRDVFPHGDDDARHIVAEPLEIDRIAGIDAQGFHHVAKVDAACLDQNFDFLRAGRAPRRGVEAQIGQDARLVDLQPIGQDAAVGPDRVLSARRQLFRRGAMKAVDITLPGAIGDLHFTVVVGQLSEQIQDLHRGVVRARRCRQIDLNPALRQALVACDPHQATQRRRRQPGGAIRLRHLDAVAREEDDARRLCKRDCGQHLHQGKRMEDARRLRRHQRVRRQRVIGQRGDDRMIQRPRMDNGGRHQVIRFQRRKERDQIFFGRGIHGEAVILFPVEVFAGGDGNNTCAAAGQLVVQGAGRALAVGKKKVAIAGQ